MATNGVARQGVARKLLAEVSLQLFGLGVVYKNESNLNGVVNNDHSKPYIPCSQVRILRGASEPLLSSKQAPHHNRNSLARLVDRQGRTCRHIIIIHSIKILSLTT